MIKVSHIIVSILIHAAVIAAALAFVEVGVGFRCRFSRGERVERGEVEYFDLIEVPAVVTVPKPTPTPSPTPTLQPQPSTLTALTLDIRYPRKARREGREGEVVVEATVGNDGAVSEARVVKSSGFADLDAAALEGIERMKSEKLKEQSVGVGRIRVPVVFRIKQVRP